MLFHLVIAYYCLCEKTKMLLSESFIYSKKTIKYTGDLGQIKQCFCSFSHHIYISHIIWNLASVNLAFVKHFLKMNILSYIKLNICLQNRDYWLVNMPGP
jgi:hypothetical protein